VRVKCWFKSYVSFILLTHPFSMVFLFAIIHILYI
jgi:hypothetical protein